MVRGPKKHLKRLAAPHHWMLNKLGGTFAPKPSAGPHKPRECIPAIIVLRNRLHYALTGREAGMIMHLRNVLVDGVVRTDPTFPLGFMDVISIPKTSEHFRLLYDPKGRFILHRITEKESHYKLGKVIRLSIGRKRIPYLVTHDGKTIRFPHPNIRMNDTIRFDLRKKEIIDWVEFKTGNICMATGGRNAGRIGIMITKEKHAGSHDIIHIKDLKGNEFATRSNYVFIIGKGEDPWISIPKEKGIKLSKIEDRELRLKKQVKKPRKKVVKKKAQPKKKSTKAKKISKLIKKTKGGKKPVKKTVTKAKAKAPVKGKAPKTTQKGKKGKN